MTIMAPIMSSILILWNLKSSNPVKTSMSILFSSLMLFSIMFLNTGQSWFPLIMLMLFMGGIIMMFMILSSILPNEKTFKLKNVMTLVPVTMVMIAAEKSQCTSSQKMASQIKSFLSSNMTFWMMMTLILLYFMITMGMISSEKSPMRSVTCWSKALIL